MSVPSLMQSTFFVFVLWRSSSYSLSSWWPYSRARIALIDQQSTIYRHKKQNRDVAKKTKAFVDFMTIAASSNRLNPRATLQPKCASSSFFRCGFIIFFDD
jgi:hypothetical protein